MLLALLGLSAISGFAAQAPSPRHAEVSGTVTTAAGRPVGGVSVMLAQVPSEATLFPMENHGGIVITGYAEQFGPVMTTADGKFTIKGLPSGIFEASCFKAGWNEARGGQAAFAITLKDSERLTGLRLTVAPWASLSGHIYDDRRHPMAGLWVRALSPRSVAGHLLYDETGPGATSDDRGFFHLELMPGDYVLAAPASVSLAQSDTPRAPSVAGRRQVFQTTYYPAATTLSSGTVFSLTLGETRTNVDLTLTPVAAFRVTGRIDGAAGLKNVSIFRVDNSFRSSSATATSVVDPQGRFTL